MIVSQTASISRGTSSFQKRRRRSCAPTFSPCGRRWPSEARSDEGVRCAPAEGWQKPTIWLLSIERPEPERRASLAPHRPPLIRRLVSPLAPLAVRATPSPTRGEGGVAHSRPRLQSRIPDIGDDRVADGLHLPQHLVVPEAQDAKAARAFVIPGRSRREAPSRRP